MTTLFQSTVIEIKRMVKTIGIFLEEEKYNPHHGANGQFTTSDNAYIRVHRDGTRELGPKHPDHPNNKKPTREDFKTTPIEKNEMMSENKKFSKLLDQNSEKESRGQSKARIAKELGERLKDSKEFNDLVDNWKKVSGNGPIFGSKIDRTEVAAQLIQAWQKTSADSYHLSVHLQMMVEKEFGLEGASHPYEESVMDQGKAIWGDHEKALQQFVRAQYDNTQEFLKANGIKEVVAYRGMGWSSKPEGAEFNKGPAMQDVQLQPMSSFATDIGQANGTYTHGKYSMMIGARVPASRILATCLTGVGCKPESELVILGGKDKAWQYAWSGGSTVGNAAVRGYLSQASQGS